MFVCFYSSKEIQKLPSVQSVHFISKGGRSVWGRRRVPAGVSWWWCGTFPGTDWSAWCSLVPPTARTCQTRRPGNLEETETFIWNGQGHVTVKVRGQVSRLTVQLVKVLQLRWTRHCVVEMWFQSPALQETVGHLCQVDPNYGIWIPDTKYTHTHTHRMAMWQLHLQTKNWFDPYSI